LAVDRHGIEALDLSVAVEQVCRVSITPQLATLEIERVDVPFTKHYTLAWDELLGASACVVAESERGLLGVGALTIERWNRRAVVAHLHVDRPVRGRGIGTELLSGLRRAAHAANARCLWVETQNVNVPAIQFYHRHGFGWCGLDTALYDPAVLPGETALFFTAPIDRE